MNEALKNRLPAREGSNTPKTRNPSEESSQKDTEPVVSGSLPPTAGALALTQSESAPRASFATQAERVDSTASGVGQIPDEGAGLISLRLASFNIQTGINTSAYHEYVTGGWRHVFPSNRRVGNLNRIAKLLAPFDLVGLQEVDGGGSRSQFIVQAEYLAHQAGFSHWHNQINRRIGNIALHSNGLLSRLKPAAIVDYELPGMPGRGGLVARFGEDTKNALHLCVIHLALSRRARLKQLAFIGEIIRNLPHVILMGDLNCGHESPEIKYLTRSTRLCDPLFEVKTFPSWRPRVMLDHILVTPEIRVNRLWALNFACSDHLPIAMEITLPANLHLER